MGGGLFDDDILDDDYLDDYDEEAEEIGVDYHVHSELTDTPASIKATEEVVQSNNKEWVETRLPDTGKRRAKIKPMPNSLRRKGIATTLVTYTNGKQVLFVNPEAK